MDTHEPIHPATPYTSSTTAVRSTAVVQHSTQQKKSIQQQATNPQCVYDNGTAAQQYMYTAAGIIQQNMRWYRVCSCVVLGCTAAHALVQVQCWDFHFFTIIRHPGERAIRPRESLSTPPARRVGHRCPFFRRGLRGLLCGAGVEPRRGRGSPSGDRESQLFLAYVITGIFSKM